MCRKLKSTLLLRLSNPSTTNFLAVYSPTSLWGTVDKAARQDSMYGIFAKDKQQVLEYRLSFDRHFATDVNPNDSNVGIDNNGTGYPAVSGYAGFQLQDLETDTLPYKVGTYRGRGGSVWAGLLTQACWLLPKIGEADKIRVQAFAAYTPKSLHALQQVGNYWDIDSNFFIQFHHAKISFQHSRSPV